MAGYELDTRGLLCPMPVIKLQQRVQQLIQGDIVTVYCTDPGVQHDIPAWCRVHGHSILSVMQQANEFIIQLRVE